MKPIYFIIGALILVAAFITGTFIPHLNLDWFGALNLVTPVMLGSVFGCLSPAPRSCDTCPEDELNKIVHIAFVQKGTVINTSTPALFISSILTAELNCNAYIIRNVSGAKGKPSTKEGKGRGKQIKRILAKEHSIDAIDFDYTRNIGFWNFFEDGSLNYDMYYFTDTYGWVVTGTQLSIAASDTITDDNTTYIEGSFTVTWAQRGNPLAYKASVDLLANCVDLFAAGLTFSNVSGSQASIVGNNISISNGGTINAQLQTGVASLASAIVVSGALPSGVVLSTSGPYIRLTGTASGVGTYNAIIKGQNACGVGSDLAITIVVS